MDKNDPLKKIKKLKILGEFLLAFGRNKIIFKEPGDVKHITLKFLEEGVMDIHETMEGKKKTYTSLEKLDLKKFSEEMRVELRNMLREIDVSDPKYRDIEVVIIPENFDYKKVIEIKGNEIIIEKNKLEDLMEISIMPMKKLQNYDFKVAFLSKEGKDCALYRIDGKYFLLTVDNLKVLANKILEKSRVQTFSLHPSINEINLHTNRKDD